MGLLELRRELGTDKKRLASLLHDAEERGIVEQLPGGWVRPAGWQAELSPELGEVLARLVAFLEGVGFQPPTQAELPHETGLAERDLQRCTEYGLDRDELFVVGEYLLPRAAIDRVEAAITANCEANGELAIPELRDALDTSRKYLMPLLEHFDQVGLTMRSGGTRVLKRR
jgi:selenocysteine-specific elongation factor